MKIFIILASVLFAAQADKLFDDDFADEVMRYLEDDGGLETSTVMPTSSTPYLQSTPFVNMPKGPFKPHLVPVEKGFLRRILKTLFDNQRKHDKQIKAIFHKLTVTNKELNRIQDEFEKAEKAGKDNNWK